MPQLELTIRGHCYSKKNSRPIMHGRDGRPFIGKSKALAAYEVFANAELRRQWGARGTITGPVAVRTLICYSGNEPDALGPLETIFDALQAAKIVVNDRQLEPWGCPAVTRRHVARADECATIWLMWVDNRMVQSGGRAVN